MLLVEETERKRAGDDQQEQRQAVFLIEHFASVIPDKGF
jgi:hypothetical protein